MDTSAPMCVGAFQRLYRPTNLPYLLCVCVCMYSVYNSLGTHLSCAIDCDRSNTACMLLPINGVFEDGLNKTCYDMLKVKQTVVQVRGDMNWGALVCFVLSWSQCSLAFCCSKSCCSSGHTELSCC